MPRCTFSWLSTFFIVHQNGTGKIYVRYTAIQAVRLTETKPNTWTVSFSVHAPVGHGPWASVGDQNYSAEYTERADADNLVCRMLSLSEGDDISCNDGCQACYTVPKSESREGTPEVADAGASTVASTSVNT